MLGPAPPRALDADSGVVLPRLALRGGPAQVDFDSARAVTVVEDVGAGTPDDLVRAVADQRVAVPVAAAADGVVAGAAVDLVAGAIAAVDGSTDLRDSPVDKRHFAGADRAAPFASMR